MQLWCYCAYFGLFVFLFLFNSANVSAQISLPNSGFFVKHYSQEDGMVSGGGYFLHKDRRGFLWIGGFEGISRFDGRTFTNFTKKDGLSENTINDLREDENGVMYASSTAGMYRYTGKANQAFKAYQLPIALKLIAFIYPIDSSHIYIADDNTEKLYFFDSGKMQTVSGFKGHVMRMERDKDGFLYIFSIGHGPLYIIKGTQVVTQLPPPLNPTFPNGQYFAEWLHKNANGKVVYSGYKRWLLQGQSPYITPYYPLDTDSTYYNYLLSFKRNYASIQFFNGQRKWQPVQPTIDNVNFNSDLVTTKKGDLYFISNQGLEIFYPKLYNSFKRNALLQYYTTANGCKVLHNDSVLYKNNTVFKNFISLPILIYSVYLAHNGTVWFNTKRGIYYLIKGNGKLQHYIPVGYTNDFTVKYTIEDDSGNTWFETNGGVIKYNGTQFFYWERAYDLKQAIYSSVVDRNGIYYFAGLGVFTFINGAPKFIGNELGIGRQLILSLTLDGERNVWIKTSDSKLLKVGVTPKMKFFVSDSILLEANGKPFIAQSIAFDSGNNLWATSYNQLSIYLKQPNGHYNRLKKMVLGKEQQLNTNSLITDEGKTNMYLRHDTQWSVFNVHAILAKYQPQAVNVQLIDVQLFKRAVDWQKIGVAIDIYGLPVNPTFTSQQNSISFFFTGIVEAEQHLMYQYKLDGLDGDWQPITQLSEANYTNLTSGEYIFYVRAANINGTWSTPLAFKFTILNPWYFTVWAWVGWMILCIVFIVALYGFINKSVKKRQQTERIVMEHKLKALRAQINPHFLQNTFSFLLQTIKKQPFEYVEEVIDQLSIYLRKVLDLTDITVLTLENELSFTEEYLSINRLIFRNEFDFTITVNEEVDTVNIKLPSMLLQPILENAIKHGVRLHEKTSKPTIDVKIYADDVFTYCSVVNSVTLAKQKSSEKKYRPKGLEITRERLELLYKNASHAPFIDCINFKDTYKIIIGIPMD